MYQILTSIISVSITHSDDWSDQTHDIPMAAFVESVGPTTILPPTVLGIFKLFFTTTLMATIVEQTNVYARQVLGDAAEGKWTDVTDADIWAPGVCSVDGDQPTPTWPFGGFCTSQTSLHNHNHPRHPCQHPHQIPHVL